MNAFRILGDLLHLEAVLGLLGRVWTSKSCAGGAGGGRAPGRRGGLRDTR